MVVAVDRSLAAVDTGLAAVDTGLVGEDSILAEVDTAFAVDTDCNCLDRLVVQVHMDCLEAEVDSPLAVVLVDRMVALVVRYKAYRWVS
jgi:hypothetical protein